MEIKEQIYSHYERLKEISRLNWEASDLDKIESAFYYSLKVIGENKFKTGEVILSHSIKVATIIAGEIGLGPDSIIAGLLHNVMYAGLKKKITQEDIEKEFNKTIYTIQSL